MGPELAKQGIGMSKDLGFNDGYGIAMRASEAKRLGIAAISDLVKHPEFEGGHLARVPRPQGRLDPRSPRSTV